MENHTYIILLLYALLTALAIFIIFIIKSVNFLNVGIGTYIFTTCITLFMFSRIIGSFFYTTPKNNTGRKFEPTVTFVIPSMNEEKAIHNTIKKCFEVDYDLNKIEVIAINDGSTDGTLSEMNKVKKEYPNFNLKIINWNDNKGKREGMATGIRMAQGEIIIQLDSDSFLERNALKLILEPLANKEVAAVVGHTLPSNKNENLITRMQTSYYFMSFRALKATESIFDMVFCCSGCFSAYRKEYVLNSLDEFLNERFKGKKIVFGDDRALTNLLLRKGYNTVYHDKALAYTVVPNNLKQFIKQQIRWKKGWFINSMRVSKFIIKRDPFVALTYFIPLILLTILTPFIAFKALIINPIMLGIIPLIYVFGILMVSCLLVFHHEVYSKKEDRKYGKYLFLWSILNMTILSYIIVYAIYDLKNMGWGTR